MFDRGILFRFLVAALAASLVSCAARPRPETGPAVGAAPPAPTTAARVFQVVSSDISVQVYRAGPLAELGHNHVIASTGLAGRIAIREPLTASTLQLALPLASLMVDEPARRAAAGEPFHDNLSQADRDGTRRNMLGPALLDAGRFPLLELTSLAIEGAAGEFELGAGVSLAGREGRIRVPVSMTLQGDVLTAHGEFTVTHAELGLTPFSAALGALRVQDDLRISYRLVAQASPNDP
jgi:hypothetical protein